MNGGCAPCHGVPPHGYDKSRFDIAGGRRLDGPVPSPPRMILYFDIKHRAAHNTHISPLSAAASQSYTIAAHRYVHISEHVEWKCEGKNLPLRIWSLILTWNQYRKNFEQNTL